MSNSAAPSAHILDISRSLRRAGRLATGVDRVERAYLRGLLGCGVPLFGLARTGFGYVLIGPAQMPALAARIFGDVPWGAADFLARLPRGRNDAQQRAEADTRRFAVARTVPPGLGRMLRRHVPRGAGYYNVGHSNLTGRVLRAAQGAGAQVSVLIHDVIPLDFPQYQRPGTVEAFRKKIGVVSGLADRVIYISEATRQAAQAHMPARKPPFVVAHIGVDIAAPRIGEVPKGVQPETPYFITTGTIEPRKNHGFLLDLWAQMGADAPMLLICGNRGWNNEAVFARLDALGAGARVREVAGLSDGALAALTQGAAGALFPSLAEGFGLPPVEALGLGTRCLCNDLPVFTEFLGEKAVYASVSEAYLWINIIKTWANCQITPGDLDNFPSLSWDDHFKIVLRLC
ncbi:MAG: glycosyltransferase [Sulfitobacter sp.]